MLEISSCNSIYETLNAVCSDVLTFECHVQVRNYSAVSLLTREHMLSLYAGIIL